MSSALLSAAAPNAATAPTTARWIDPRGQRFGAGFSALVLLIALAGGLTWLAALVGVALAVSSAFGTRWFVFGRPWPVIRSVLRLAPTEPEHEYPPRFAQALGATFVAIGSLLLIVGASPWGWIPILGVIALQLVLAATGYCLGCRLYFIRWYVPALFARLIGRA
ncbi:MAG TPA: DUF4395 domain-containing protein [Candidatus Limnocylindria bacterium]|nr:DUF4395 domain-containing protein [Candidatus Limnocylindria bacterium]